MSKAILMSGLIVLSLAVLAACKPEETGYRYSDLPPGDAARGADLFGQSLNGAAACSNCHSLTGSRGIGPALNDYAGVAGERVDGQSAGEYTFYSILRPSKHLVRGFSNVMPDDYEKKLSRQEVADLITYLLTLGADG